jgi:two-component system invasion response regulator UvrY
MLSGAGGDDEGFYEHPAGWNGVTPRTIMITVLIGDDHAIVREGLKKILSETPDIVVSAEACDGQEVLEKIRSNKVDVVVLDIAMPGRGGLDTLMHIKRERPNLPVLVLSIHPEDQYAVRVLKAGAYGYLTKDSAPDQLISAVRKVVMGRKYVSPSLAEQLAFDLESDTGKPPHEILSDREYEVLCMIAAGNTVKEIAYKLSLSVKTISTYRARILDKMKMKTNAELTSYAIREGLISESLIS